MLLINFGIYPKFSLSDATLNPLHDQIKAICAAFQHPICLGYKKVCLERDRCFEHVYMTLY
jgi:hypothetical protein